MHAKKSHSRSVRSTLVHGLRSSESPIFSPDLEKGRGSLDFPPNVRDPPDEIPSTIIRPKPGTRPESRDSPIIHARQQVTSPGRRSKRTRLATQSGRGNTLILEIACYQP